MANFFDKHGNLVIKYEIEMEDFSAAGEASKEIKKILRQLGIDNKIIRKIAIVTYEAEINLIVHSFGGVIDLRVYEDKIAMRIKDKGPGIRDIDLALQEGFSTASNQAKKLGFGAGMGLPHIKAYSDEFEIISEYGQFTLLKLSINI